MATAHNWEVLSKTADLTQATPQGAAPSFTLEGLPCTSFLKNFNKTSIYSNFKRTCVRFHHEHHRSRVFGLQLLFLSSLLLPMMMKDQIEQLEVEAAGKIIFNPPAVMMKIPPKLYNDQWYQRPRWSLTRKVLGSYLLGNKSLMGVGEAQIPMGSTPLEMNHVL